MNPWRSRCAERQAICPENFEQSNSPRAYRQAEQSADESQKNGFDDYLSHDMHATRAHRSADRHFFRPPARTNQKKIHQIYRADEKKKSSRQDANDLSWDTVYAGITTQNVWIGIEILPPEGVRQDNDVLLRVRFFIGEVAADRWAYTKSREKFRRDAHDFLLLHGARITDGFGSLHIHGKALEGRNAAAALVVVGDRRTVILDTCLRISIEDRHQPIGLRKGKRTEQNGIDYRENREVRSQADRDGSERGECERRRFAKLA